MMENEDRKFDLARQSEARVHERYDRQKENEFGAERIGSSEDCRSLNYLAGLMAYCAICTIDFPEVECSSYRIVMSKCLGIGYPRVSFSISTFSDFLEHITSPQQLQEVIKLFSWFLLILGFPLS
jgi:hypothetical protein